MLREQARGVDQNLDLLIVDASSSDATLQTGLLWTDDYSDLFSALGDPKLTTSP